MPYVVPSLDDMTAFVDAQLQAATQHYQEGH